MQVLNKELGSTKAYTATSLNERDLVNEHVSRLISFRTDVEAKQDKLPTMYWIPKLHKTPYKSRFIANSSACTTTNLSKLLTSCLSAVKTHVVKYCEKAYENSGVNLFWSIKNSMDILEKLKNINFRASLLSTYDFSTLYTTLPHILIKSKLTELIQKTFAREDRTFLACNHSRAFFTNAYLDDYTMWTCSDVCNALIFLLDNIYVRLGDTVYRQVVGIPMGTNCAPLVADLFLFCYERDFMLSLSPSSQNDIIEAFNRSSRYLDDILNIDNPFFAGMVDSIYPPELTLNKANTLDTQVVFLDLSLSISNNIVTSKIYDKRDDFNFNIVNYPHLDGDVPRTTSYGVYMSQLVRFARVCGKVEDFNDRNKFITSKLLQQGFRYHKLRKTFSNFYRRNTHLVEKYNTNLKTLLQQSICHPEFYGDIIYKVKKIKGSNLFPVLFTNLIRKFVGKGYDPLVLLRTVSLVIDPFTVDRYTFLFNCATTGQPSKTR